MAHWARPRRTGGLRLILGLTALALGAQVGFADPTLPATLEPVGSTQIADKKAGFTEPSGLVQTPAGDSFWSVSDNTGTLFRLDEAGAVVDGIDLGKHTGGLEGIAWDAARGRYLLVREESGEILVLRPDAPGSLDRFALDRMAGFRSVSLLFAGGDNNGLEGITVVPGTGTILVIKERNPRLLLEVTGDLTEIRGALLLTAQMGFETPDLPDTELDISGIAYDQHRKMLWITSDTGRAVFLFDPSTETATGFPLTWSDDGQTRRLENPEGVALSADGQRLYVVTDDGHTSRLVSYDIR